MNIRYSYTANTSNTKPGWLLRGYTGHEHLPEFNLINMNGRMYDPLIARMLSPDNYVQSTSSTQAYNRYSYAYNNPLKYTDPSGDFIFTLGTLIAAPFTGGASLAFLPAAIGADLGMWSGGSMANGTMNPFKWDYSSGKTWGYMAGGALAGAASGYIGGAVATSGMPFANTTAIIAGSTVNSILTTGYTNFQTDVSVDFGIGSFNATKGTINGLWNWNNLSAGERFGYSLGALANVSDVYGLYTDYRAAQHERTKGERINPPSNFDPFDESPAGKEALNKILGTLKGTHFYGADKTGWDPEQIRNQFGINPTNAIDALAYFHDIAHYNTGTNGLISSLLTTNRQAINANITLLRGMTNLFLNGQVPVGIMGATIRNIIGMSLLTSVHLAEEYSYLFSIYNYR